MKLTQKQIHAMQKSNSESNQITKNAIKEAFLALLKNKPYQEVRITEIINEAGVSRSAFYHNYKCKQDIMIDMFKDAFTAISSQIGTDMQLNWEAIFSYVKYNEWKIRLLLGAGLQDHLLKSMNESYDLNDENYNTALWNGMIYNAILHYAKAGFPDPKEAAASVHHSMQTIARAVLSEK